MADHSTAEKLNLATNGLIVLLLATVAWLAQTAITTFREMAEREHSRFEARDEIFAAHLQATAQAAAKLGVRVDEIQKDVERNERAIEGLRGR